MGERKKGQKGYTCRTVCLSNDIWDYIDRRRRQTLFSRSQIIHHAVADDRNRREESRGKENDG